MKIILADTAKVDQFDPQARLIIRAIGIEQALITDESQVRDFLLLGYDSEKDYNDAALEGLAVLMNRTVDPNEYIAKLAEELYTTNIKLYNLHKD